MRIAIVGAGAVGCLFAARLAACHQVTLIARRSLVVRAIRDQGIELTSPQGQVTRHAVAVTDDPLSVGPQDAVVLCVKAYALPGVLGTVSQLTGPRTAIVPVLNGVPWWFLYGRPKLAGGERLAALDVDGGLAAAIPFAQVIGGVTYVAVERTGIGRIHHVRGGDCMFGEPGAGGGARSRAGRLSAAEIALAFRAGGLEGDAVEDIRAHVWTKLLGNAAFNPLSVLTGATQEAICADLPVCALARRMMMETQAVGERLGIAPVMSIEARIEAAAAIGAFRTSMLQDHLAGQQLELAAMLGAVIELAERLAVEVPTLRMVHALADLRGRSHGD
ncbi:2-dehydropantoate 2-reductase [Rhodovastum atsumiense]|nr:2-dehydropantoate 2-reductase [Rhodovastum atsumiense]CAH2602959.1 2-dehydropantoate 2-reductase [Rhodovastum atsumiense]